MNYFSLLPQDLIYEISYLVPGKDIKSLLFTDTHIYSIINTERYWKNKLLLDYPQLNINNLCNTNFAEYYLNLDNQKAKLVPLIVYKDVYDTDHFITNLYLHPDLRYSDVLESIQKSMKIDDDHDYRISFEIGISDVYYGYLSYDIKHNPKTEFKLTEYPKEDNSRQFGKPLKMCDTECIVLCTSMCDECDRSDDE